MNFEITEKYVDPRTVDLDLVDREIAEGNPYAALLKAIIQQGGFGHGLSLETASARDTMAAFALTNPLCAVRHALLILAVNNTKANEARVTQIIRPLAKVVSELADADNNNYYARTVAAEMYISAYGVKRNFARGEDYHRQAIAMAIAESGHPYAGSFSRQRLALFLNSFHEDFNGGRNRTGIPEEEAQLRLGAAEGGLANAQRDVGIYYADYENSPLSKGKSLEERFTLAEKYFLLAERQGLEKASSSLARLYVRQGRNEEAEPLYRRLSEQGYSDSTVDLANLYERQERFEEAAKIFRKLADELYIEAILKDLEYSYEGKPGVPKDETRAYRACVALSRSRDKVVTPHIRDIEVRRKALLARAWVKDPDGKLRRARQQDDIDKTPFRFMSEDLVAALAEFREEAKAVSIDLALILAEYAAEGLVGPVDNVEARHWYSEAARLGHVPSMLEVIERGYEGRPGDPADLAETLRWSRTFLSKDRRREGIPPVKIKRVREIEADILGLEPGKMPRLWILDAKGSLRRLTTEDELNQTVVDPYLDIERYVQAANENEPNEKSAAAATTAARLYDAAGKEEEALAMYRQAVIHGNIDAGVEVAERYFAGKGTPPNFDDAYYVGAQLCTTQRDRLSSDDLRARADTFRDSILSQAWVLTEGEILRPVKGGVAGDLEPPAHTTQLLFFPRDAVGLKELIEYEENSIDATVDVALRLLQGEGSPINTDAAFWRLTSVLIDSNIIQMEGSPGIIPADSPRREELQKVWDRLVATISIAMEEGTGDWVIHVAGAPDHIEPTVIPQTGYEKFIELLKAGPQIQQQPSAGPRIPTRPFRRRDQGLFFE